MLVNGKQERAVIHLELNGKHYYYGNLKALCDSWDKDDIGIAYNYLKNYGISEDKPYIGKKCIIRKGAIILYFHQTGYIHPSAQGRQRGKHPVQVLHTERELGV